LGEIKKSKLIFVYPPQREVCEPINLA